MNKQHEDKKQEERAVLDSFRKSSALIFEIFAEDQVCAIFKEYTNENPDFIIRYSNSYFGMDVAKLCLPKSKYAITKRDRIYANMEHLNAVDPNIFDDIPDEKMIKETVQLRRADTVYDCLGYILEKKLHAMKQYVTDDVWFLFYNNEIVPKVEKIVRRKYEDSIRKMVQEILNRFPEQKRRIKKIFLYDYNLPEKTIFECLG